MRDLVRACVVVATLSTAVASAAPDKRACLSEGRKLVDQKEYAKAVDAFEVCLLNAPDDEVLLSEQAAAAYLAKNPTAAEAIGRRAVAVAQTPAIRAASLYTLGLAEHDYPDLHLEVEAYLASLRLRPNAQVSARLAKVKPGVTAEPSFAPAPMAGPYASIEAFCKAGGAEAVKIANTSSRSRKPYACQCQPSKDEAAAGPFLAMRLVTIACEAGEGAGQIGHLAVQTRAGWFVGRVLVAFPENERACSVADLKLGPAEVHGALVAVRHQWTDGCSAYSLVRDLRFTGVAVAGVGPSGKPGLVGPIVLSNDHALGDPSGEDQVPPIVLSRWKLEATITPAGELDLEGDPKGWSPELVRAVVGRHALVFP